MSNTKQPTYEELMEMLQKERSKNAQLLKNIDEKDAQIANFFKVSNLGIFLFDVFE